MSARSGWREALVCGQRDAASGIREIELDVPSWPGHLAGQHVEVRVRHGAEWSPARSYSIADPATSATRIHLAVRDSSDGDAGGHLADAVRAGLDIQVHDPRGERMVWAPEQTAGRPLLLLGGGIGIVPLMAIARTWERLDMRPPLRLVYSVRAMRQQLFRDDLARIDADPLAEATTIVTGADVAPMPVRARQGEGRLSARDLEVFGLPSDAEPECFVCGPVSFVESVTRMLMATGHPAARIHTEWSVPVEVAA